MSDDCYFCLVQEFDEDIIFQNEYFFAIFDSFPATPGHALLIPKRHIPNISPLILEEAEVFFKSIEEVKKIIKKINLMNFYTEKLKNTNNKNSVKFMKIALENLKKNGSIISGFNYGINEGEVAGQTVKHLHAHIFPRFVGDVEDPVGGVRNTFPGMGNYKKP